MLYNAKIFSGFGLTRTFNPVKKQFGLIDFIELTKNETLNPPSADLNCSK